ncbi:3-dehydroquinate synthase family protein [Desulfosarcina variabilis]|uniref:3-dehydroquinate synthase family protein n=1 Tax=Desulfosarcina variabilis TaxID=2300 RepID=UPI003AFB468D
MFEPLAIRSHRYLYKVNFLDNYMPCLRECIRGGDVVFIDKNILKNYPDISDVVQKGRYRIIEPKEETKSFSSIEPVIDELLSWGITKSDRIIAVGGGITQDVCAFTASILLRGMDLIYFPTNLLSQADSCIGSKTSINFKTYKNQIGGFYPPAEIYISPKFLKTLQEPDLLSGLGEMIHYFCVSGKKDYEWAKGKLKKANLKKYEFGEMIQRSLSIKKKMIEIDEFDRGPRNVFNYGHSFGHAIESATDYTVPHGIAVGFGMDLSNCLSEKMGLVSSQFRNEVRHTLELVWKTTELKNIDCQRFFTALRKDKKNEGDKIKVILTRGFGEMFKANLVLEDDLKTFISDYFKQKQWESDI